ncbi:zf-ZPR1-domain-containing protein [Artomyces pyxidatus]|uniref:Zf-ZPR1-domain-containing protein n=1 Tax=Artomyces pyxidatus TaxID=48021 RepID=A0ACB8TAS4_9AGAM|nr:zf-ZPR1-domain-containing protein [Artomyces pyxidatus]
MAEKEDLFPSIGSIAEQTHEQPELTDSAIKETKETGAGEEERTVQEIDSLCMNCEKQARTLSIGVTRLLLTTIPYFREVIVMSFRCEHCGFHNNEVTSAGVIRPEGTMYTARILSRADLDRQIVKSDNCTVTIPQYELTIPPSKGQLTTVEGLIRDIVSDLSMDQPLRRIQDEPTYTKIQALIDKLKLILADEEDEEADDAVGPVKLRSAAAKDAPMPAFTLKLDDPAGNSFIEFVGSMSDPKWDMRTYHRTREQNVALGLVSADDAEQPPKEDGDADESGLDGENEEIFVFPGICSSCGHAINTNMKKVNIPYFKDILIMSTNCDRCGYRDNEVKSGSAISAQGKKITLKVEDREDLSRDILKSESCGLTIPEIDLVLHAGTLGGRFTTLEGILEQVYEELSEKVFAKDGDSESTDDGTRKTFEEFLKSLKAASDIGFCHACSESDCPNLYAPDPDPNMETVVYERTWGQNEELGLNDMKVEGYEEDSE